MLNIACFRKIIMAIAFSLWIRFTVIQRAEL